MQSYQSQDGFDDHLMNVDEILLKYSTTLKGYNESEVNVRRDKYGLNELAEPPKDPTWKKVLRQFSDVLVIVLLIAALITATLKPEDIDWIVIVAIVIITAFIGYLQEAKAEEAIDKLKKLAAPKTVVIRSGEKKEIRSSGLVPGDVIYLDSGMRVSADARLIEVYSLKVNESALTGESVAVDKIADKLTGEVPLAERRNMLYMGTIVEAGRGIAVVTATGMDTEIGRIAELIEKVEQHETPLQKKLKTLGKKLGSLVLVACAVIFGLEIFRNYNDLTIDLGIDLFETSVSIAVAAIPEGLPAVVTIALAIGLKVMAKRNVIIRKLPVVETLGSATVICTDKTGTLTTGILTTEILILAKDKIRIEGAGLTPQGRFNINDTKIDLNKKNEAFHQIMMGAVLCSDAIITQEKGERKVLGDNTEGAVLVMAEKAGYNYHRFRERYERVEEKGFDSDRKMMTTVHVVNGTKIAYTKGAPENVLKICSKELVGNKVIDLTGQRKDELKETTAKLASMGYRPLAFAYDPHGKIEHDLIFLGIVGMRDQVRPEAKDAVAKTKQAGIRVIMITGDHKLTAAAVGKEIGMISKDEEAINSIDLDRMDDEKFSQTIKAVSVYARASPEHKVRIVRHLKSSGEIVAMTGDGVNDAPALKMADIGVAMGITGTDVSKEASDMIITDDNFASIVAAVEEGRGIYDNIRKVVQFLLSCNMSEVTLILLAILIGLPLPLIALQILWLNLVTDSFPALALDLEPKEPGLMKRKPRSPDEKIITKDMVISILISAIIITVGTLSIFWYSLPKGLVEARTMALTTMVMFQMWTAIACRSTTHTMSEIGWFSNPRLLVAIAVSVALMIPVIYLPQAQPVFGTTSLGYIEWIEIIIISMIGLVAVEIWEWLNRKHFHLGVGS